MKNCRPLMNRSRPRRNRSHAGVARKHVGATRKRVGTGGDGGAAHRPGTRVGQPTLSGTSTGTSTLRPSRRTIS